LIGFLANRFGGKFLFGGGVFITAVLTILTPFCAQQKIALLVAVRVLEGLCEVLHPDNVKSSQNREDVYSSQIEHRLF
jgi:MFS family permease